MFILHMRLREVNESALYHTASKLAELGFAS